jgi:HEAT repeat protein
LRAIILSMTVKLFRNGPPDVEKLRRKEDVKGLVRACAYEDPLTDRDGHFMDLGTEIRERALEAVAELEPAEPEVHDALVRALEDPEGSVRAAAVRALGRRGDPWAVDALVSAVVSWTHPAYHGAREEAVETLAALAPPDVAPRVAGDLLVRTVAPDGEDAAILRRLARASGEGVVQQTVGALVGHLREASAPDRVRTLLVGLAPECVDPLIAALSDARAQREAALALGEIRDAGAMEQLSTVLVDGADAASRAAAAWALGQIKDPGSVEALLLGTRDQDYGVREAAINAFDSLGNAAIALATRALLRPAIQNGTPAPAVPLERPPDPPSPLLRRLLGR